MHAVNLQRLKYLIENQDSWVERKLLGAEFKISEKYSDAFQDVETIPQFCDESRYDVERSKGFVAIVPMMVGRANEPPRQD